MMKNSPWLVGGRQAHGITLYCFSHAGGSATSFMSWREIGDDIAICAVQLPGRGERLHEPCMTGLHEVVVAVTAQIVAHGARRYAFFGHSLGALLAFEVARRLMLMSMPGPDSLIVSGCGAPQLRDRSARRASLADDELIRLLGTYDGTAPELLANRELMNLVLPVLRADFALADDYVHRPGPKLKVPITVLAGREDDSTTAEQVAAWQSQTTSPCTVHWFDGGHMFIDDNRSVVLQAVRSALSAFPSVAVSG